MSLLRRNATIVVLACATLAFASPALGADAGVVHDADLATDSAVVDSRVDAGADTASEAASDRADDAAADAPADDAQEAGAERIWASCMEHVPEGATKPQLEESFPERGWSGYALPLHITVRHGRGETVLPNGFHVQRDSDAARAIDAAGFAFPSPDGGSSPTLTRRDDGDGATTEITIPLVALPPTGGRHELTMPPVPIAISRASGELLTLCTRPHAVTIDDPIANEPDPSPKGNPDPRRQREQWTLARDLTYGVLIGGAVAAVLTWLVLRWLRRPRPVPPPPPPRPPWEVALEELAALRSSPLLASGQIAEHVDRVSDTTRRYLGALYEFDGIESTTDEVLAALAAVTPKLAQHDTVRALLADCDLVKFARWLPTSDDCVAMVDRAEQVVRETMPAAAAHSAGSVTAAAPPPPAQEGTP